VKVTFKLPFLEIEGDWEPDEKERSAAWELYVELITRITVAELRPDEGLLRETLSSIYSLFQTTRSLLRSYGPSIAAPKAGHAISFGYIAVAVLNVVLRPLLAKWHPLLLDYEARRDPRVSSWQHERAWEQGPELVKELNEVRTLLIAYADLLAEVAGVSPLKFPAPQ
jgi:hypothetical protein